ncbi:conserved hypothetical protein [Verticillium alfalfae VaMs.102]|uniref:Major facilitator superfamily (MFS) profile domain-containing protein n=1 Tax=Verticillium alfalfae (strain VaMs.102 / ATCC MYA-4576 / FGSC 10136) TaxID=526221 RepID=C9SB74_VERA1|nr:conserved hypothetical protein [Verticillium alfalfae VaMs.102]EEY15624.1 conserved hypothetical protein [Verticillium alfalfae VaMs.102]
MFSGLVLLAALCMGPSRTVLDTLSNLPSSSLFATLFDPPTSGFLTPRDPNRGWSPIMASSSPIDPATRKRVLKVIAVSLLLDLISFTFILPLFPKLLEFYRDREAPSTISGNPQTLLQNVITYLNKYKASFSRPIDSRYDIVLLGGALGSLFSLLQAVASPIIGHLSDRHGRRTALLASMMGNIVSVLLWVCAVDFRTFVASRVVGGLSEGNVQLATAMATDISDDASRGSTMALIGACFSIAFTFGPRASGALAQHHLHRPRKTPCHRRRREPRGSSSRRRSFEAGEGERGGKLGILRSWGQLGRGLGPILFTSVYWWAGREMAYGMGAAGITVVAVAVFSGLKTPPGSVKAKVPKEKKEL